MLFNSLSMYILKIPVSHPWKTRFSFFLFVALPTLFSPPFLPNFPSVWHLWQQKNTIAVGTCAHTRTREKLHGFLFCFLSPWLLRLSHNPQSGFIWCKGVYCKVDVSFPRNIEWKMHFFSIFPLFGAISTHISMGGAMMAQAIKWKRTDWGSIPLSRQKPVRDMARVSP